MDYNVILEYVNITKKYYLDFFKIVFKNNYKKNLCVPFIDRYIEVRYYNETNYFSQKDIVKRLNQELVDVYKEISDKDNMDYLKNVVALFGYIIYFDEVCMVDTNMDLINSLMDSKIFKIDDKESTKKELKEWYIKLKNFKDKFNDTLLTKDFSLDETRLDRKLYYIDLKHNVRISNLYSEYAVDKAYNSGVVKEDKLFVMYILLSSEILNDAVNLNFSKKYIVPMFPTLFEKEKKIARLLNVLSNPLAKKLVSIRIDYEVYKKYKSKVDKLINDGYSFALDLNTEYNGNLTELVLFQYIIVDKDSDECEMLIANKGQIKSKIIKL